MLVLARNVGEQIRIGEIIVQVVAIRSGGGKHSVRLGITAPADVPVHREEVYQSIRRQEAQRDLCE